MDVGLFGIKPISQLTLTYCHLESQEFIKRLIIKFPKNIIDTEKFTLRKYTFENVCLNVLTVVFVLYSAIMHVAFVYAFHHDLLYPVIAVYWGRANKHGATEGGKLAICINLLFMLSYYGMRLNSINK